MIGTKEQYEKIQQKGYAAMVVVTPVEISPLLETIEALREVARLGRIVMRQVPHGQTLSPNEEEEILAFWAALNALPDWILE